MVEVKQDVRGFLTAVGGDNMMKRLKVKERMLRHVAERGVMPASWYAEAKAAAKAAKQPAPDLDLFDFK